MRRLWFLLALLFAMPALAVQPDEMLADPVLEARARTISEELRCVVCQNQSIDDSDAPLARDLRIVVREQLQLGKSDDDIMAYIVSRYGNFVLLRPPVEPATWALWAGPFAVLIIGGALLAVWSRRRRLVETPPLTAAEIAEINRLPD
ncbi:cytochrome c-type biogenesis protein CcmH [Polymorphobacter fuscus]|uniref:Cytochrome c-type biogenesis protein n=2 Tax=Sandarakinorhabdus fusca TaxID=1439888 RepID=A0A7C9KY19_9SPHN|nr:cytochrome c-type biogenesis protein [Polymorphobacter fuscus]KAB7646502.1 cytochrome c-type biogenesis protein CcmH [Polymorphobacter fuscus]MQT17746.1 cytochrome c-type biogenesis protein CcmH [Polymorphobacter fuscus]